MAGSGRRAPWGILPVGQLPGSGCLWSWVRASPAALVPGSEDWRSSASVRQTQGGRAGRGHSGEVSRPWEQRRGWVEAAARARRSQSPGPGLLQHPLPPLRAWRVEFLLSSLSRGQLHPAVPSQGSGHIPGADLASQGRGGCQGGQDLGWGSCQGWTRPLASPAWASGGAPGLGKC